MTAGGLEVALAKAAASAVARLTSPVGTRVIRGRKLKRASYLVDTSEVNLPTLTPAEAASVSEYIGSPDFHVVAVQSAFSVFETASGRAVTIPDYTLTDQLREGLRRRGDWDGGTLRQLVELLKEGLSHNIAASIHQAGFEKDVAIPASILAAVIASVGDQAAAAVRNSSLLHRVDNLGAIHEFEVNLRDQIKALTKTMQVPNASALRNVAYESLYVEPVLSFTRTGAAEDIEKVPGSELLNRSQRAVILGDPGGGKSTLATKTVHDLANGPTKPLPFLLVLRNHIDDFRNKRSTIVDHLADLCRSPYQVEPPASTIEYLLLNGRALVVFDGLDEIFETHVRTQVVEAISGFAHRYPNTLILVSSRKVGYDSAPLDRDLFPVAELAEFSTEQVKEYTQKWFALDQPTLADKFIEESELVADLRTNPLMLSLMCGLYRAEGYIPANRPDVYEKCALMLFERWDKQRGIIVPLPFDAHVRQAIQSLAWWLYTEPANQAGLTRAKLLAFMTEFLHRERFANRADAENAAASFVDFCTGRAWVLSKVGSAGGEEVYGFTHRTFLEYFAATQMVRKYPDARRLFDQLSEHLERAEWEVVCQLALQTLNRTIDNGANDFLEAVISTASKSKLDERSNSLAFAARSLAFVVPNPVVRRRIVSSVITFFIEMPDDDGNPQTRYLLNRNEFSRYDLPYAALGQRAKEIAQDIDLLILEYINAALDHEPVADNILLIGQDPGMYLEDVLDSGILKPSINELSRKYNTHLEKQRFVMHDLDRVRDGELPVSALIDTHGVEALYLAVGMAGDFYLTAHHAGLYYTIRGDSDLKLNKIASTIMRDLLSREPPWIHNRNVIESAFTLPVVPIRSDIDESGLRSAIALMTLPVIECALNRDSSTEEPPGDAWYEACVSARAGVMSESDLRANLARDEISKAVTDFIVRWSKREFNLLADN
jgi:hypothetical protein